MSAPIDDLLYGGDDSGDEDELNTMPMSSFSAPLPATSALPMVAPPSAVLGGPPAGLSAAPPPMNPATVSAPVSTMAAAAAPSAARPLSVPTTAKSTTAPLSAPVAATTATTAAAPPAAPVKQAGSGHQMFQQMFALLKQMLPPEQYAALHSEMRNGNGNDIKSIVDIIKRIAGDAIFASVIQRMDLTRNQSAAAGSLGIVKSEPVAAATVAGNPAPAAAAAATPAAVARPTPLARPLATPPATAVGSAPIAQPLVAVPAVAQPTPTPAVVAAPKSGVAAQRPTLIAATPPATTAAAAVSTVKAEPAASFAATPSVPATAVTTTTPIPTATPTTAAPAAAPSTSDTSSSAAGAGAASAASKNDTQEKIQFAKKLLFHASSCVLPPGSCQVKRCDDVRRVFKHSVSCGGARGCSHCRQLKALVEYHAKECLVPVGEHCKIPFCDGIRKNNAAARARAVSVGTTSTTATAAPGTTAPTAGTTSAATAAATPAATAGAVSDDDEDNTPLASAVTKVKKNNAKAKSPKSGPVSSSTGASSTASKKKSSAKLSNASTPASNASTPSSTGSSTPAAGTATAASAAKPKPSATLTQAQEYGRLLQLILHVEKCKSSTCPVGDECAEAKSLLRQVNAPDAPPRAQTYKKVYAHYKVCRERNNTQNCPMCKIGLLPIETTSATATTTTAPATSGSQAAGAASTSAPSASPTNSAPAPAASPTASALKRQNSSVASPRSPSKKPRVTTKGGKATTTEIAAPTTSSTAATDQQPSDLVPTSRNDLRKEEDVLTHTGIDLSAERRAMMDRLGRKMPERLPCKKEEWIQNDLFRNDKLTKHMEAIAKKHGVSLGSGAGAAAATQVMAHALQEYLKQVIEEMVEAAKLRGDAGAQALDALVKKELSGPGGALPRELTSTDILRVSCDDSFARLRQEDLALRARLLEDAKREELVEKERSKKRKKIDRVKLQAQEEKDEAEMDVEELAVKDLKERLLQEDKDGVLHVEGRVNESITTKFQRRVDEEVTMEDATYWLENQKPYINPKLFVRAEAARIVTKSLL